jgi:hypothetical protein
MQISLRKLIKQPNWSFVSILLVFSWIRFLHPHHTNSVNARYLCESGKVIASEIADTAIRQRADTLFG